MAMPDPATKNGTTDAAAMAALERFVVENDDLLALEARIGRFNIFDALGIARAEIRHSNFLAFLLDPAESHGLGQLFLKAVLMDLLKNAPAELRPLSPIELDGTDLRGVELKREWRNIDLLITCKEPRFAIAIENKVDSAEHSDQLTRYRCTMKDERGDHPCLFVYLTPEGDDPSGEDWTAYSYASLFAVLQRVRETHHNAIGDEVLVFLDHYLRLLEARFMPDQKLDELCRRIYHNHRQALDLIWDRVGDPDLAPFTEFADVLDQDPHWEMGNRATKNLSFRSRSWLSWLPAYGADKDDPRWWFNVYASFVEGKIVYTLWTSGMSDLETQRRIVPKLRQAAANVGFPRTIAAKVDGPQSQLTAAETLFDWDPDGEPNSSALRIRAKKGLDELHTQMEKLAEALKPLLAS